MSEDHDLFYREPWMSDDQWCCAKMLADLFYGFHHIDGKIKPDRHGIKIGVPEGNWAMSYDYDGLTRAVVMAHDRSIRFRISPAGVDRLKLHFEKRHHRDGKMTESHPTIEDAITRIRNGREAA
ncbi:hypothetical protein [Rhizobium sp. BK176]|uniref:hypothetical protein n=1 Tax=Rhizobium sp. BK176 TaxID=2587071 RepID=UPI002169A870|nr:hypothetical protein [Rhizobium sp. BK176]MCS4089932.1 hypothetical protein [Rhizobium sp. BK176]